MRNLAKGYTPGDRLHNLTIAQETLNRRHNPPPAAPYGIDWANGIVFWWAGKGRHGGDFGEIARDGRVYCKKGKHIGNIVQGEYIHIGY